MEAYDAVEVCVARRQSSATRPNIYRVYVVRHSRDMYSVSYNFCTCSLLYLATQAKSFDSTLDLPILLPCYSSYSSSVRGCNSNKTHLELQWPWPFINQGMFLHVVRHLATRHLLRVAYTSLLTIPWRCASFIPATSYVATSVENERTQPAALIPPLV